MKNIIIIVFSLALLSSMNGLANEKNAVGYTKIVYPHHIYTFDASGQLLSKANKKTIFVYPNSVKITEDGGKTWNRKRVEIEKDIEENNKLYLNGKNIVKIEHNKIVSLTNLDGKNLLEKVVITESGINFESLSKGTYFIIYEDKDENMKRITILK